MESSELRSETIQLKLWNSILLYRFNLYFCILFSDNKTAIATDLASCNLNNACAAHGHNFNLLQFSEEVEKSYKHWSGDKSESEIEFARVVE